MTSKILRITGSLARQAAIRAIQECPEGMVMRLSEPTRNLAQNSLLHAELQEISGRIKWAGVFLETEDWKRLLTAAWMRATDRQVLLLPAVDGHGIDALYRRTSTLTKSEMSELIEYIRSWKAERPEFQEAA